MKLQQTGFFVTILLFVSSIAIAADCNMNTGCSYTVRPGSKEVIRILHLEKKHAYLCKVNGVLGEIDIDQDQVHAVGIMDASVAKLNAMDATLEFSTQTMNVDDGIFVYHHINYSDTPSQLNLSCSQKK